MRTISVEDAVAMIPNGASLMIGGFMGTGTPERVIDELVRQKKRDLVVIANDTATPARGIGKLVAAGLVGKAIASHIGLNPDTQKKMIAGDMIVDLVPQGTLIERIRAGGCGLGGVLTPRELAPLSRRGSGRSMSTERAIWSRPHSRQTSRSSMHFSPITLAIFPTRSPPAISTP